MVKRANAILAAGDSDLDVAESLDYPTAGGFTSAFFARAARASLNPNGRSTA
jgi:hypothetical protein